MGQREPEDVFTPKTIVSREMFARRNEPDLLGIPGLQDTLRDALRERGGQVLIFGDTGVGKSSLLKWAAEDEGLRMVSIECFSNKSFEDLIEDGIRKLVDARDVQRTKSASLGAEAEAGVKVPWFLSFKGKIRSDYGETRTVEVVAKPPLDALLEAMKAARCRLMALDNFQNIKSLETRSLVAQTMEYLSDRAGDTGDVKCVVIGIADDASSLIGGSGSFTRRTAEVGVPRMPDEEIEEVLARGFGLLNLEIAPEILSRLVFFSDGFPYFAHLLGLSSARMARRGGMHVISEADVDRGIKQAVTQVDRSFAARLEKAYEKSGDTQPRRRILKIMSQSDQREWQANDIVAAYRSMYGRRDDYTFLHVAFGQLIKPSHGAILKRNEARKPWVSQFADPQMRPYLRLNPPDGA